MQLQKDNKNVISQDFFIDHIENLNKIKKEKKESKIKEIKDLDQLQATLQNVPAK